MYLLIKYQIYLLTSLSDSFQNELTGKETEQLGISEQCKVKNRKKKFKSWFKHPEPSDRFSISISHSIIPNLVFSTLTRLLTLKWSVRFHGNSSADYVFMI